MWKKLELYLTEVSPNASAAAVDQGKKVRMQYAELLLNYWGALAVAQNRAAMAAVSAAPTAILMEKGRLTRLINTGTEGLINECRSALEERAGLEVFEDLLPEISK
jgi:hypothetical protein